MRKMYDKNGMAVLQVLNFTQIIVVQKLNIKEEYKQRYCRIDSYQKTLAQVIGSLASCLQPVIDSIAQPYKKIVAA